VVGHLRFGLERIGPELRQYIIAGNDEERPFSRDQRRWVYASAKLENNYFGFGTDNDLENRAGYVLVRHSTLGCLTPPSGPRTAQEAWVPVRQGRRGRARAPEGVPARLGRQHLGMSFGSLSGPAIAALNSGARLAGCLHNTGEGGISTHHRRAAIWCGRSARRTSAAATSRAASTWPSSRTWSSRHRFARSRSS
jgi:hypothetical protein